MSKKKDPEWQARRAASMAKEREVWAKRIRAQADAQAEYDAKASNPKHSRKRDEAITDLNAPSKSVRARPNGHPYY